MDDIKFVVTCKQLDGSVEKVSVELNNENNFTFSKIVDNSNEGEE